MKRTKQIIAMLTMVFTMLLFSTDYSVAQSGSAKNPSASETVADVARAEKTSVPNSIEDIGVGYDNAKLAQANFKGDSPMPEMNQMRKELIDLNFAIEQHKVKPTLSQEQVKEITVIRIPELEKRIARMYPSEQQKIMTLEKEKNQ